MLLFEGTPLVVKKWIFLLTTLIIVLAIPSVVSQIYSRASVHFTGTINYPPEPPQPPSEDYYNLWESDYRVGTDFLDYLNGSTFDFDGFFDQLHTKFLQELETTVWGEGYQRPTLDYGSPSYSPGDAVGNLEVVANYVCDTESEIHNALSACQSGDIIFIKPGTYVGSFDFRYKTDIIIAGGGWDTLLKLPDDANTRVLFARFDNHNIIIRDLAVDGNKENNPSTTTNNGIDVRTSTDRVLLENVYVTNARRMGITLNSLSEGYVINSVSTDAGWNTLTSSKSTYVAAVGNLVEYNRDVGMTTWASNNLVYANNVAVYGIHDNLGFNDANWGIGVETQGGSNPQDCYNIILRNNICSEHNQAGPDEPWKGTGIYVMGSDQAGAGTYNIIIDGNILQNNNRAGLVIAGDSKYPDLGHTIVVVHNYASGNNIYNRDGESYGNYVIHREGVVLSGNVDE